VKLGVNRQLVCRLRRLTRLRKVYLESSECVKGEAFNRHHFGHEVPVMVILKTTQLLGKTCAVHHLIICSAQLICVSDEPNTQGENDGCSASFCYGIV
jgi:hypothetical protein